MKKRILSMMVALSMIFTMTNMGSFALSDGEADVKIEVGTATGKSGDIVSVDVNLIENKGFVSCGIHLTWPKDSLSLVSIEKVNGLRRLERRTYYK